MLVRDKPMTRWQRAGRAVGWLALSAALTGCAALYTLTSEVATYGNWPVDRPPGRYAFERLPSQQADAERQAELETAAARALELAGFTAAPDAAQADVIVQLGARISRSGVAAWDDPLGWRWGLGYWQGPGWHASHRMFHAGLHADRAVRYERQVALLLRDRASGTPLYEAHAQTDGVTVGDSALLAAMFEAALQDFPAANAANPRAVSVQIQH